MTISKPPTWWPALVVVAVVLQTGCIGSKTTNVVDGLKCQENLENLFVVLRKYGESHEKFPLDDTGQIKLGDLNGVTEKENCCPKNRNVNCYLFRKGIRPTELDAKRVGKPTIIAMDVANNHPVVDGKERVQVLMNQGFAQSLLLDTDEAADWRKRLIEGDVFGSSTSCEQ